MLYVAGGILIFVLGALFGFWINSCIHTLESAPAFMQRMINKIAEESAERNSEGETINLETDYLAKLPLSTDIRRAVKEFCEIAHKIDLAMPLANHESSIYLFGGWGRGAKKLFHFWYNKDWSGIDDALAKKLMYNGYEVVKVVLEEDGWFVTGNDRSWLHHQCYHATGFEKWAEECDGDARRMEKEIRDIVHSAMKDVLITKCRVVVVDDSITFSVEGKRRP